MKSKRNFRRKNHKSKSRKYKRGGGMFDFFLGKSATTTPPVTPVVTPTVAPVVTSSCDPLKISDLLTAEEIHSKYQSCCPKSSLGIKNNSPYCKQLELNFQSKLNAENDANEYHGFEPEEVYNMKQQPNAYTPVGGRRRKRKTRRYKRKH